MVQSCNLVRMAQFGRSDGNTAPKFTRVDQGSWLLSHLLFCSGWLMQHMPEQCRQGICTTRYLEFLTLSVSGHSIILFESAGQLQGLLIGTRWDRRRLALSPWNLDT
eukprot:364772-Chlamydomonas_euryale.AAC.11